MERCSGGTSRAFQGRGVPRLVGLGFRVQGLGFRVGMRGSGVKVVRFLGLGVRI